MSARDDHRLLAAYERESTSGDERAAIAAAMDEIDALRDQVRQLHDILDGELTYRDLEMKIRDGTIELRTMSDPESTTSACQRWLTAMIFHVLLGDANEMPDNYRGWKAEWALTAAGEFGRIRLAAEVIKPGGRASHDIRIDLENRIAKARMIIEQSRLTRKAEVLDLLDITPAPDPQPLEEP